jgi:hypothetical protein
MAENTEEEFFNAFNHDKPADNIRLIAAYFYREYGIEWAAAGLVDTHLR